MTKHGEYYELKVYEAKPNEWVYDIYHQVTKELVRESNEWFDCEMRATWAAIGHISLLENGEG
jgi:hypothetical protein